MSRTSGEARSTVLKCLYVSCEILFQREIWVVVGLHTMWVHLAHLLFSPIFRLIVLMGWLVSRGIIRVRTSIQFRAVLSSVLSKAIQHFST